MTDKSAIEYLRDIQLITNYDISRKYSIFDQSIVSFDCFSREHALFVEQSLLGFLESSLK